MTASDAILEALEYIGLLVLSAIATFLLLYFGYHFIRDVNYIMEHSEQGSLKGIRYFWNK